jgi:hypothetical protein
LNKSSSKVVVTRNCDKVFRKRRRFIGEVTASVENENDRQELQNCMNEAAFSNCNAEGCINIDRDVQTEPGISMR